MDGFRPWHSELFDPNERRDEFNCRYCFTINGGTIKAKVREQPDGSLYVSIGGLSQQLKGQEEVRVVVESRGNVDG